MRQSPAGRKRADAGSGDASQPSAGQKNWEILCDSVEAVLEEPARRAAGAAFMSMPPVCFVWVITNEIYRGV
jgi:hypothetical protein